MNTVGIEGVLLYANLFLRLQELQRETRAPLPTALFRRLLLLCVFDVQGPLAPVEPPEPDHIDNSKCRALMLDVIRRAIHDWVLYRQHRDLQKREIAIHAATWLFREEPGHPWWEERQGTDLEGFSLRALCESLDISVEAVRARANVTTIKDVLSSGRPADRRRGANDEVALDHHGIGGIEVDELDRLEGSSHYENQFVTYTPAYTGS